MLTENQKNMFSARLKCPIAKNAIDEITKLRYKFSAFFGMLHIWNQNIY